MQTRAIPRLFHPLTFLTGAVAIYSLSALIVNRLPHLDRPNAVAVGVVCDLALAVPLLYYLLLVRGRGWPLFGVAPVFVIGVLAASWILPEDRRQVVTFFELAAIPLELGLIGYIGWRAVTSVKRLRHRLEGGQQDAFDAIRQASLETVGVPLAAAVMAQEIASIYYAFFSWRTPLPAESEGFTSYKRNSYGILLWAFVMVVIVETLGVHLLIHFLWSPVAAWIFTALGLYGLIWMIGDFQALRLRPTRITSTGIVLRLGTRWEAEVPLDQVARATVLDESKPIAEDDVKPLKLVLLGAPHVELRFSQPVTVRGLFGIRRETTRILMQIDDPEGFTDRVQASTRAST